MAALQQNGHVNGHVESLGGDQQSKELIDKAVNAANSNALRLALYQLTGDEELHSMSVTKAPVRGGALLDYVLVPEDEARVRDKARDYLFSLKQQKAKNPQNSDLKLPTSPEEAKELMRMFHGNEELSSELLRLGYEELAFNDFPRQVEWSVPPSADNLADYHVVIIGAGINGLASAIQLEHLGIPYTLIDRQPRFGGTWLENNYPDVRVDTLGFNFKFKSEPGHFWKEMFPSGGEIRDYLDRVAKKHKVIQNCLFNHEVVAADWNEDSQSWDLTLRLADGSHQRYEKKVNAIISAVGLFSTPQMPDIAGIHDFKGHMWHTTRWDHGVEWRGKDVAIIGNGSSGVQLVPEISKGAASLAIYQRTPQWMAPSEAYRSPVPEPLQWLLENMPLYSNWNCYAGYVRASQMLDVQVNDPEWQAKGGLVNARNDQLRETLTNYIKKSVEPKQDLVPQLVPKYAPLVRRLVMDGGYYEALLRDNTELVTDPIETFTSDGIRTKNGKQRHHDIVVLACGFQPTNFLHPVQYTGRNRVTLDKTWEKDGARSYLGMMIPGYPNLFTMYGPNHQPRGGPSILSWAEIWAQYAVRSIVWLIENNVKSMDVKQSTYEDYNAQLDASNKKLLWESEGRGYFVNKQGRQAVNAPWTVEEYYKFLIQPINEHDFIFAK